MTEMQWRLSALEWSRVKLREWMEILKWEIGRTQTLLDSGGLTSPAEPSSTSHRWGHRDYASLLLQTWSYLGGAWALITCAINCSEITSVGTLRAGFIFEYFKARHLQISLWLHTYACHLILNTITKKSLTLECSVVKSGRLLRLAGKSSCIPSVQEGKELVTNPALQLIQHGLSFAHQLKPETFSWTINWFVTEPRNSWSDWNLH